MLVIGARITILCAILLLIGSCAAPRNTTPALAEAFVGPAALALHQDLNPKSPVSATVHHGEKLEIVEYKRRFLKVRTSGGIVGWTDVRQLITPEQMAELERLTRQRASYPSQGLATAFETLNVHTEPNRTSPGFMQIAEGAKVDVIDHKIMPRTQTAAPAPQPPPRPKPVRKRGKDKRGIAKIVPPPFPAAPKPPENWVELSKRAKPAEAPKPDLSKQEPAKPVPMDDWSLIRSKDGHVGWVLARMVGMAIPDEVAQYAEGHRISSYFAMGDVQDEGQLKHNWLWTTIGKGPAPYEFDSFRFFIWSRRHHRYETAYIERNVIGHYPVEANASGPLPTFKLILEDDNGGLWRKTYSFEGGRVHLIGTEAYQKPAEGAAAVTTQAAQTQTGTQVKESWYARMKRGLSGLFKK